MSQGEKSNRQAWMGFAFHLEGKKVSLYEQVKWHYDAIKMGRGGLSLDLFKHIEVGIIGMTDKEQKEFDIPIKFCAVGVNKKDILFIFKDDNMTRAKLKDVND